MTQARLIYLLLIVVLIASLWGRIRGGSSGGQF
jgi:hypothetical protein